MGYDISLVHPVTKKILQLDKPHQMKGSTYAVGGTTDAHLAITYNYALHYYKTIDEDLGVRLIYEMSAADSIPILEKAVAALGDDIDKNYWTATEGNAKAALLQLIALAKLRPDGIWRGD